MDLGIGRKVFATLVIIAFIYVASPLIFPIAMGGIFAVLFSPWLSRMQGRRIPKPLASAILTLGVTVVFILPISFLIFYVAKTGVQQLQAFRNAPVVAGLAPSGDGFLDVLMNHPQVHRILLSITKLFPVDMPSLSTAFHDSAGIVGTRLAEILAGLLGQLPGMLMGLLVVVLSLYFLLIDGHRLAKFFRRNQVFTPQQTDRLITTVAEMCRSVILASVISGTAQALIELIACVCTGTPNAFIIAMLVFIASFIPVIGSMPITLGVAFQQLMEGNKGTGIALIIVFVVIISVDNVIRPAFLKGSANLHPLLAFVAAFGGLQTMGFLGVFFGPIIAALFVVTVNILTQPDEIIEVKPLS
jgi:predicted PurR-regulated permease PerM